ncbi:EF-hand domain-containing protein [Kitasatospora sp. NPDC094011]|uniref:EF-hand domain-containing protein n=1 Tax=Kitasatospora sp. NPDC094011 TaxID=3364090 RepID=UPI0037FE907A
MSLDQQQPNTAGSDPDLEAHRARIYAMLDTDGDGTVSRHDYFVRIDWAQRASGRPDDDPLVIAARVTGEKAWAAMDADGDGFLTFDQYNGWVDGQKFDDICKDALAALFDLGDGDGDGAVTREEFATLREVLGNQPDRARAAFDILDADQDGYVRRDEYLAAIRAYVTGAASPMGAVLY